MFSKKSKYQALTGAEAAAEAMRQINPEVVPVYPITPQTPIVERFAKFKADGRVNTEVVTAESEHSVMSIAVGAAAAGARVVTASSSAGLALMYEILGVASGLRLPILMNIANRALSSPINIHCDHSDSMGVRDSGWIQIYSENPQEVYDHNLLALMLAEAAILPAMVMQDGFITSHSVENVELLPDAKVTSLLGNYRPAFSLLDADNPITVGALQLTDYYFETKRQQVEAMRAAAVLYKETALALSALTKREYPKIEKFNQKGAKRAVIVMSSTAGTAKAAALRFLEETGEKVAVLKIRLFLPFPKKELQEAVKGLKRVAVLDRALSFGSGAPLLKEVKNALFDLPKRPEVTSYVFGLGGREIFEDNIISVFKDLGKNSKTNKENYIGLRE